MISQAAGASKQQKHGAESIIVGRTNAAVDEGVTEDYPFYTSILCAITLLRGGYCLEASVTIKGSICNISSPTTVPENKGYCFSLFAHL